MKLDWGNLKGLPWRHAWSSRRPLVFGGLTLWGLGLAVTGFADHHRAERQTELVSALLDIQKQYRWQLAQLEGQSPGHRFSENASFAEMTQAVRPHGLVEVAQKGPVDQPELRGLLAQNDVAPKTEAAAPAAPAPEAKPIPTKPENKPAEAAKETSGTEPTLAEMPPSLELNPVHLEDQALPEVPKTEDAIIGIPGESINKPAEGTFAAALASSTDPTDEIADPDERRLARVAFEQAGRDFAAGKWKEAKTGYEKVLKLMPKHPAALVNQGLAEERLGNDQAARVLLEEALTVQPDAQPALMSLGLLYSKSGELSKAMARLTRLIELSPRDARAHNHLGVVFAQKSWREAAEAEFRTAIELNPLYQQAHFNLALMYLERTPPAVELARRHYATAKQLGAKPDKEVDAMLASTITLLPGEQPPMAETVKKPQAEAMP